MTVRENDSDISRAAEKQFYMDIAKELYQASLEENKALYDFTYGITDGFSNITAEAIMNTPSAIKILRYCVAPPISQMKFGQLVGLRSVSKFEGRPVKPGSPGFTALENVAADICDFINLNIDKERFVWLTDQSLKTDAACENARLWTCSLVSCQNAGTSFRKWRKNRQEEIPIKFLEQAGYSQRSKSGAIFSRSDIEIGEYARETKIKGRTIQKADLVFRSRKTEELVLIEAKAVGVEIDATKRVKECCDKANDWLGVQNNRLGFPKVVALIAGFFTDANLASLRASNIEVVWEHNAHALEKFL